MTTGDGGCCFDRWAEHDLRRARRKRLDGVTARLLSAMESTGVRNRSFLDVGCGAGALALAAVERGATTASGVDLGPGVVEAARTLAAERGLADRAQFAVGDGAVDELRQHDVVALNRVICCYPGVDDLLTNTLRAAGEVYAYVVPCSGGVRGLLARGLVASAAAWCRLRKSHYAGFRPYVHDLGRVDRLVRAAGFELVHQETLYVIWHLATYRRVAA